MDILHIDNLPYLLGGMCVGGIIGAAIGGNRGRAFLGFLLGAALGPLGWLCALAIQPTGPQCPECLNPVNVGASRCGHCGSLLRRTVPADAPPRRIRIVKKH